MVWKIDGKYARSKIEDVQVVIGPTEGCDNTYDIYMRCSIGDTDVSVVSTVGYEDMGKAMAGHEVMAQMVAGLIYEYNNKDDNKYDFSGCIFKSFEVLNKKISEDRKAKNALYN